MNESDDGLKTKKELKRKTLISSTAGGRSTTTRMKKATETTTPESTSTKYNVNRQKEEKSQKPPFRPALDDTKPALQDPILRSDPMETEEAVLRVPPLQLNK